MRRSGSEQPKEIELTREQFVTDETAGGLLHSLLVTLNERLASEPRHPGLLELRAELAGQWSDIKAQVADYTAAIEALSNENTQTAAADLKRLHVRRGSAHVALRQWPQAVEDFAKGITAETTKEELLTNQARAQAEVLLTGLMQTTWTPLKPAELKSKRGATLTLQDDGSILASGVNPRNDFYTITVPAPRGKIAALLLEAIPDSSMPSAGVGRGP